MIGEEKKAIEEIRNIMENSERSKREPSFRDYLERVLNRNEKLEKEIEELKKEKFVAVDIGCIECGERTSVLGIFTDERNAKKILDEHQKRQDNNWCGQHDFEIFEIKEINKEYRVDYKG